MILAFLSSVARGGVVQRVVVGMAVDLNDPVPLLTPVAQSAHSHPLVVALKVGELLLALSVLLRKGVLPNAVTASFPRPFIRPLTGYFYPVLCDFACKRGLK